MMIFPRIHRNALFLVAVALVGSVFSLAQSSQTDSPAASAAAQSQGGQQVQLEGQLEITYHDLKAGSGRLLYFLKLPNGSRVPLQFTKEGPTNHRTGDHVRAQGQLSGGTLLLTAGSTSLTSSATSSGDATGNTSSSIPLPYTLGAQSTLVILVNFQDDAVQPYAVADVENAFFSTASNFFLENSSQQTSLTGTVVGWYTIPVSVTTCDDSQIATDAQNAAVAGGVNLSNYTRYVYLFPQNTACAYAGASFVGGKPSQTWINGTLDTHVIDHELGHAFGLWHAHLLNCGASATICSSGTVVEYGDPMDTMGVPETWSADYNAFQKAQLGWLNYGASPSIQTVTSSGTYTIYPYELAGPGPNALKVLQSTDPTTGAKTWYYLEARQAIGFDAFLTDGTFPYNQTVNSGVLFHLGTDGNGNSDELLDMTPATLTWQQWWDFALGFGQSFQDSTAGVTFTTQSVTSAGATVNIQFSGGAGGGGGSTSQSGTPALTVATSQATYSPGQNVSVSATATSGGSPVANVSVSFAVTSPNGSRATGSATTGKNGVAVYKIRLKQSAPAGTYAAGAAATIKTNSLNANTQFAVQ